MDNATIEFWWSVVMPVIISISFLSSLFLWGLMREPKKKDKSPKPKCDHCGSTEDVKLEDSRTQRYWNGSGIDPNSPIPYCRKCAEMHHDYWDAMWEEYNNSRG